MGKSEEYVKRKPSFTKFFQTHKYQKFSGNLRLWRLYKTKKSNHLDFLAAVVETGIGHCRIRQCLEERHSEKRAQMSKMSENVLVNGAG